MSIYLYLQCDSHNPPLQSAHEVGQHLRDLPRIREESTGAKSSTAHTRTATSATKPTTAANSPTHSEHS